MLAGGTALATALVVCATDASAPRTAAEPDSPAPFPAAPAAPATAPAVTIPDPAWPGDFPDPFVLRVGDAYFTFATNSATANVPVMRSTDLARWEPLGDALPHLPGWAAADRSLTWAPAVVASGGAYVLFYTARYDRLGLQCIGRAMAAGPAGPYADTSAAPFLCQTALGGSIDPAPFADSSGALYLLWKNDGNCCGKPVAIWSQRLDDRATRLLEAPARLIAQDQVWEDPLIEGPTMWHDATGYHLLYSANWYDSDRYAVGYARCAAPMGPCVKPRDRPILASRSGAAGPGGESVFADALGRRWLAYHAWTPPAVGYAAGGARSLRIGRLVMDGDVPSIMPPEEAH